MLAIHPLTLRIARAYFLHFPITRGKTWLRNWYTHLLQSTAEVVVSLDRRTRMVLDLNEPRHRALFFRGVHEREEMLFRSLLEDSMVVFDIGANVGLYALIAASRIGKIGAVHAFEPEPHNFTRLEKNLRLNQFKNVVANRVAVSDGSEAVRKLFVHEGRSSGKHSFTHVHAQRHSIEVLCTSLDQYVDNKDVPKVDIVKIDVEGAEMLVLRGARQLLGNFSPIIICEVSDKLSSPLGYSSQDVKRMMLFYGYKSYRFREKLLSPVYEAESHECENLVFVKNEHFHHFPIMQNLLP